ncbi:hypothetical protein N0V83_006146 [Neocucurbitaria cava]|uniref:RRM domain-containing protein n=1 Tax=Neocucurbitaria cava TaxID=798079 RepID=A0A9W8Y655_9PLEO|nr:hypothetical protein N0V83_006146 [Neocucurbitaria cava]
MSDSDPAPATTSAVQPPDSPADSDKTIAAPMKDANPHPEFPPGCGAAIFSTELGTRPPRPNDPPYQPVIARGSDTITATRQAAEYWQKEFWWQCLCIFPGAGWTTADLWDPLDLHLEGPLFCDAVLNFISWSTLFHAKKFAEDFARAYPDRLEFVAGDMELWGPHNRADPFDIVDKVYTDGERGAFPRTFLWHVIWIMRTTAQQGEQAMFTGQVQQPAAVDQPPVPYPHSRIDTAGKITAAANEASSRPKDTLIKAAPSKTNRKQSRSRARRLTVSAGSSPTVETAKLPPAGRSVRSVSDRGPSDGFSQSRHPSGSVKHGIGGVPSGPSVGNVQVSTPTMATPNMASLPLRAAQGAPRNMGPNQHNQTMAQQGWAENANRVPSGPYSSHGSGAMSNIQSPQFVPGTMAMGQPMMIPPNAIPPYAQGPPFMSPLMTSNQHYEHAMFQRGWVPAGQPIPMQMVPMGQAYMQQAQHPMGNMTNNAYYTNNMPGQHMDPRAAMPGQASHFNNRGMLYDPYNGTNPKFNDAAGYSGGKKSGQGAFANQPGRPRKTSYTNNRPGYGQHGVDRPANAPANVSRHSENSFRKPRPEDDPDTIQDRVAGCHDNWIGPKNETVTELFVGDLPDDVQPNELKDLFVQHVGIKPSLIDIKYSLEQQPSRLHAFISFSSASDAKKALQIRTQNPYLRHGSVSVTVSVPRRFFTRAPNSIRKASFTSGSNNALPHASKPDERVARGVAHMSSHDEESVVVGPQVDSDKPLYSPQDARSDLQKKTGQQSEDNDPMSDGSPKARKSKPRPSSPAKETVTETGNVVEVDTTEGDKPVDVDRLGSAEPEVTAVESDAQVAKEAPKTLAKSADTSLEPSATITTPSSVGGTAGATREASSQAHDHEHAFGIEHGGEVQTQSSLGPSTVETEAPVVKIPIKSESDVLKFEQPRAEVMDLAGEQSERPALSSQPPSVEDAGSDDDAKNDTSFHSAQESQTDVVHAEPKPGHPEETVLVDQGTTAPELFSTKESSTLSAINTMKAATTDPSTQDSQLKPAQSEQEAMTESKGKTKSINDTESLVGPTKNVMDGLTTTIAPTSTASTQPAVEALKKGGASQMVSLSPFAKPTKAQQKKERELKKKQQKKEQAEKEKAKAEKAKSSTKVDAPTTGEAEIEHPQFPGDAASRPDHNPVSAGKATKATKTAKGKGKAPTGSHADEGEKATGEAGSEDHGKIIGGITTSVPEETASVTHKNEEPQTLKMEPTTQILPAVPEVPSAPSLEAARSVSVSTDSPAKSGDSQVSQNEKKPTPAVSTLSPQPDKLSTHSKGSELSTPGHQTDSSSTATTTVPTISEQIMSHHPTPSATSPAANSPALDSENLESTLSPSAIDSGNALNHLITSVPPRVDDLKDEIVQADASQEEVMKKKKKKPKKKPKKHAESVVLANPGNVPQPADAASGSSVAQASIASEIEQNNERYSPFTSQFSHIEALEKDLKDEDAYNAMVDAEKEADQQTMETQTTDTEAAGMHAVETDKLSDESIKDNIYGYARENLDRLRPSAVKVLQDKVAKDFRRFAS